MELFPCFELRPIALHLPSTMRFLLPGSRNLRFCASWLTRASTCVANLVLVEDRLRDSAPRWAKCCLAHTEKHAHICRTYVLFDAAIITVTVFSN